ncbi:MAG: hypothetical protein ACK5V5_03950 [Cyclobacteriaceae bacterium]|jgi:hypothetical protein|nr:hypothetical protein [Flammeovirgaceae bacterium]
MMGFGGFWKQMAETNRVNREMLKGGRKKKFDRQGMDSSYRRGEHLFTTKAYDPNAIKLIRKSLDDQRRSEKIRTVIKFCLSILITAMLFAMVFELIKRYVNT